MSWRRLVLGAVLLAGPVLADEPLRFGVVAQPPFAMEAEGGGWEGISVDLFAAIAAEAGLDYSLVETTPDRLIEDVTAGRLDGAIGPVAMTAEREAKLDFSHAYYHGGLGVAEAAVRSPDLRSIGEALRARVLGQTLITLTGLLFVIGMLVWLAERRRNPGQFEPSPSKGLFSGFWWASVTVTGVGYGDKTPITLVGRLLAIFWMFNALLLTTLITAQLSAALTAERISNRINSVSDLAHVRLGCVSGTAAIETLRKIGARPTGFPDTASGLAAVSSGQIDAFVDNEAVLVWNLKQVSDVTMSPVRLGSEDLAFILPQGSEWREPVNTALLKLLASDQWTAILRLYLGIEQ